MVTKPQLITLLDNSTLSFAMFMASGTQEGTAVRILFENVDSLDLNGDVVKLQLMPMLLAAGAVDQLAIDRINTYVDTALGTLPA